MSEPLDDKDVFAKTSTDAENVKANAVSIHISNVMKALDDKDVFEPIITAEAVRADINEWKATLMFRPQFKTSIILALENLEKLIIARTTREGVDNG